MELLIATLRPVGATSSSITLFRRNLSRLVLQLNAYLGVKMIIADPSTASNASEDVSLLPNLICDPALNWDYSAMISRYDRILGMYCKVPHRAITQFPMS